MQLAYQVPILQIVASNANFTSDWFRVPVGSSIRMTAAITAIAGAPAGVAYLDTMTANGNFVNLFTLACAAISSLSAFALLSSEFVRMRLTQAGAGNTLTMSSDIIVSPPDSAPA